jgi:hypothetical protein
MDKKYATQILIDGLAEHPQTGFRLYNAAASSSGNKESTLDIPKAGTLLEDDILKVTIPVVRDVVHISTVWKLCTTALIQSITASRSCKDARRVSAARRHHCEGSYVRYTLNTRMTFLPSASYRMLRNSTREVAASIM